MTMERLQNVVQENLRSVMGLLQRREKSLPEMMNDRIKYPMRPNQPLHAWRFEIVSNFIQSRLSGIENQRVEGIREQN